ncbi:MAG: hypothetical protein ACREAY_01705 [Nitrososphaera sp.]|uniref:hypothetical protein n=1 Tax=Nitrososphaera sp. TaxID=1971748 RepID=UPI003D6E4DFB
MRASLAKHLRINARYRNNRVCSRGIKQRCMIRFLALAPGQTRNSIAKKLVLELGMRPSNSYSYVFKELEKCLIPSGIVEESGYKKTGMGPRALQESGIPTFRLTHVGMLVATSIEELGFEKRIEIVERYLISKATSNPSQFPLYEFMLAQFHGDPKTKLQLIESGVFGFIEGKIEHPIIPMLEESMEQMSR